MAAPSCRAGDLRRGARDARARDHRPRRFYGAVAVYLQACRKVGVKPIIGAALEVDGEEVVIIARNLRGYSNLCRLFELAHGGPAQGRGRATIAKVAEQRGDLFYSARPTMRIGCAEMQEALGKENVFSELHHHPA